MRKRSRWSRRTSTLCAALLATGSSSCCFGGAAEPTVSTPIIETPPPPPPTPPEILASGRADHIVEMCVNRFGSEARQMRARYGSVVADEGPDAPALEHVEAYFFAFPETAVPSCRSAHDAMLAAPNPLPDLDAASTAYVTSLEALAPIVVEARTYYERETFREDEGAGADAIHGRLTGALDAFLAASDALHAIVSRIERGALEIRLAALAADPARRGEYLVERSMGMANAMITLTDAFDVVPVEDGSRIEVSDPAPFHAAVDAYQQAAEEMVAAPESATVDTGGSYRSYSTELVTVSVALRRGIESEQVYPDDDASEAIRRVVDGYNQVVDAYNRTRR